METRYIARNIVFYILFSVFLLSCYNENKDPVELPDPLLSHEQMVQIITDIQLAEGIITVNRLSKMGEAESLEDSVYKVVLDHYGISGEVLQKNMYYYNIRPKQMELIFEDVLTNLNKIQSELNIEAAKKAEEKLKEEELEEEKSITSADSTTL